MTERKCEWLESEEFKRLLLGFDELDVDYNDVIDFIRARVEEEIRKEREACAKICETYGGPAKWASENADRYHIQSEWAERLAHQIRMRDPEYWKLPAIRARGGEK